MRQAAGRASAVAPADERRRGCAEHPAQPGALLLAGLAGRLRGARLARSPCAPLASRMRQHLAAAAVPQCPVPGSPPCVSGGAAQRLSFLAHRAVRRQRCAAPAASLPQRCMRMQVVTNAECIGAGVHFNTSVPWQDQARAPSRPRLPSSPGRPHAAGACVRRGPWLLAHRPASGRCRQEASWSHGAARARHVRERVCSPAQHRREAGCGAQLGPACGAARPAAAQAACRCVDSRIDCLVVWQSRASVVRGRAPPLRAGDQVRRGGRGRAAARPARMGHTVHRRPAAQAGAAPGARRRAGRRGGGQPGGRARGRPAAPARPLLHRGAPRACVWGHASLHHCAGL